MGFLIMDRAAYREEPSQPAAQATGWLRAEADARPTSRRPTARSRLRTDSGWASGDRPSSCWPGSRRSQCPFCCHSHTSALQREGGRGLQPVSPHPPKASSSSLPLSAFTPSVKQGCTHLPPMTPEALRGISGTRSAPTQGGWRPFHQEVKAMSPPLLDPGPAL